MWRLCNNWWNKKRIILTKQSILFVSFKIFDEWIQYKILTKIDELLQNEYIHTNNKLANKTRLEVEKDILASNDNSNPIGRHLNKSSKDFKKIDIVDITKVDFVDRFVFIFISLLVIQVIFDIYAI